MVFECHVATRAFPFASPCIVFLFSLGTCPTKSAVKLPLVSENAAPRDFWLEHRTLYRTTHKAIYVLIFSFQDQPYFFFYPVLLVSAPRFYRIARRNQTFHSWYFYRLIQWKSYDAFIDFHSIVFTIYYSNNFRALHAVKAETPFKNYVSNRSQSLLAILAKGLVVPGWFPGVGCADDNWLCYVISFSRCSRSGRRIEMSVQARKIQRNLFTVDTYPAVLTGCTCSNSVCARSSLNEQIHRGLLWRGK